MKSKSIHVVMVCSGLLGCAVAGCTGRTIGGSAYAGKIIMRSQSLGPTLTQSTGDHMHSIGAVIDQDMRALFHDLDLLYQTEKPTRLTPWHDR